MECVRKIETEIDSDQSWQDLACNEAGRCSCAMEIDKDLHRTFPGVSRSRLYVSLPGLPKLDVACFI